MDIVPLDQTNAAEVDAWFDLAAESQRVEFPADPPPSRLALVGGLGHPWPGQHTEWWVAKVDGELVGTAQINLPQLDNTETATVDVLVSVRHRRRGIGRALFETLVARTRAENRVRIITEAPEPLPGHAEEWAAAPFSEAMGLKRALEEVRRRLVLADVRPGAFDELRRSADAASPGYRLVQWGDRTPDELLEGVAYLEGRMTIDPPLGDLHWEPEAFDGARIRGTEAALRARGRHVYNTGAVDESTGEIVGYTMYAIDADVPQHAWQNATIVRPEHRGKRLGLRLKLANTAWVQEREPELTTIDTWNAADNGHMIAVNEAMGFVPIELSSEWQLDL